jgi:hypothetical protein
MCHVITCITSGFVKTFEFGSRENMNGRLLILLYTKGKQSGLFQNIIKHKLYVASSTLLDSRSYFVHGDIWISIG